MSLLIFITLTPESRIGTNGRIEAGTGALKIKLIIRKEFLSRIN
jgi:hypothetical protein